MDGNVLLKIKSKYSYLTPSEKKVADYILKNPKEILQLSIQKLSQKSNTSQASISRFCRTLELKGYQELRITLSHELANKNAEEKMRVLFENIGENDSTEDILQKISLGNIQAIESTNKILNIDELEKAINAIDKADKVAIFGLGASSIVGLDAQYKFNRIGIPAVMYLDTHMQITIAALMKKNDVVLGISNSGKTKEILEALEIARRNGAITISLTQSGDTPIHHISDITLNTAYVENNFRSGAMASRIAQLNIIDSIFIGVACKRYDDVIEKLRVTREAVNHKKN
jgi:DNA-binding MurR/RpiR family transcriptional regulator